MDKTELDLSLRGRAAYLGQNEQSGKAGSLRLRVQANSAWAESLKSVIEIDLVDRFFPDFNSDGLHFNGEPLLPDVGGVDLNQLHFEWAMPNFGLVSGSALTIGRQTLNDENERVIGSASVWQNEQSFDAIRYSGRAGEHLNVSLTYIAQVNRIFGRQAGPFLRSDDDGYLGPGTPRPVLRLGEHDHNTVFATAAYNRFDYHKFQVYGLGLENKDVPAQDGTTVGLRYQFKYKAGVIGWLANIEVADQYRELSSQSLSYHSLAFGLNHAATTFFVQQDMLGANQQVSFIFPLSTLHEFQGWADAFLVTPAQGIEDNQLRLLTRAHGITLDVRYHDFKTASGSDSLGREVDFRISKGLGDNLDVSIEYAHFQPATSAGAAYTKIKNMMATATYAF